MGMLRLLAAVALAASVAACGGSDAPPGDASALTSARLASPAASARLPEALRDARNEPQAAAVFGVGATVLMDWAELRYPNLFPSVQPNRTAAPYIYRYYPETKIYLGVDGDVVRVMGGEFGPDAVTIATLGQLACQVFPEACVAPVARAGSNQTVTVGTLVTLDATASVVASGAVPAYQWAFVSRPAGSAPAVTGATTARPTLRPDVAGSYVMSVQVSDGRATSTATVTVVATAAYSPPIASAGSAQSAFVGSVVTLSCAGSSAGTGRALTYAWTLSRPLGSFAVLDAPASCSPRFTPDVAGSYGVSLVVNDGTSSSAVASAVVTVISVVSTSTSTSTSSGCCRRCTTGKACGDSCISTSLSCHKGGGCAC